MPVSTNVLPASCPPAARSRLGAVISTPGLAQALDDRAICRLLEEELRRCRRPPGRSLACAAGRLRRLLRLHRAYRSRRRESAPSVRRRNEFPSRTARARGRDSSTRRWCAASFRRSFRRVRGTRAAPRPIERVEIGDVAHQAALGELLRQHVAEPFDVHGAARRKVANALVALAPGTPRWCSAPSLRRAGDRRRIRRPDSDRAS